jgi:glycosyltransferase involved in cell wall biosynthesis
MLAHHSANKQPTTSVVIPAKNEAKNLPQVLPRIPHWVQAVILVDGHSTDDTIKVTQQLHSKIRIVQQQGRGKGDALRCGFAAVTGDIIVMLDADGSTNPLKWAGSYVSCATAP